MPIIKLITEINAPIDICFDLARSIDLHSISTSNTHEKAIAGRTTGLIEMGETVTWEAIHFGVRQKLTSRITGYDRPMYFRDEQVKGAFKSIRHDHRFEQVGNKVVMTDTFDFDSPFGIIGKIFNYLILTNYMTNFLIKRNKVIKEYAETETWKEILKYKVEGNKTN
jgi:ligand-binding SRPBCC domain-containing protein